MEVLADGGITSAEGFLAGATYCGIKKRQAPDLALVCSTVPCAVGATFTTSQLKSEALVLSEANTRDGKAQAIIANSGNANACTGEPGRAAALEMAELAAAKLRVEPRDVIVASTGIIGVRLPIEKIRAGIEVVELTREGGRDAAQGILTTDTRAKEIAVRVEIEGRTVTIGGMAKGAGMIHPNMATMFAFMGTDVAVEAPLLQELVRRAVADSFNMIDIDGDTSPSDTVAVMANGLAGNAPLLRDGPETAIFAEALAFVCQKLAKDIVRDAEGGTKLIEARVRGARTIADARLAARAIVASNLVKTAVYGNDPNWGRVLTAVGYSGAALDQHLVDIALGDIPLMVGGEIAAFDRSAASAVLAGPDVPIAVDLHLGNGSAAAWGSDLTEEYVRFNAKYTT